MLGMHVCSSCYLFNVNLCMVMMRFCRARKQVDYSHSDKDFEDDDGKWVQNFIAQIFFASGGILHIKILLVRVHYTCYSKAAQLTYYQVVLCCVSVLSY